MSYFDFFAESVFENLTKAEYEYIRDTIEEKLKIHEFLFDKTSVYQTATLYETASTSFRLGGIWSEISAMQINQLAEQFRNDRWKIYYEYGVWCVNTYMDNPHLFHEKAAVDFICKSIGCLTARDSPIPLTIEEKNYTLFRLVLPIQKMSPKIADDIVVTFIGMMEEINKLNSLSNPIH